MLFDSVGLGYTARDGLVYVSYPAARHVSRVAGGEELTAASYGGGFPVGPVPSSYWVRPPNAITAERVGLWRTLLDGGAGDG